MADPKNKLKKNQYYQYPAIEISANDFTEIIFSDVEGYIIGTEQNPVTSTSISINFTDAKPGTEVLMFHQAGSKPLFNAGDPVSIFREFGGYVSSTVNPISILFISGDKIMIVYGNESGNITSGVDNTSAGTIVFDSSTQVDIDGFSWRINGVLNESGTVNDLIIPGTPSTYDRIDILEGGASNDVYWKAGEEAEDQPFPAITPGRVLLATIARNTAGSNTVEIEPSQLQDLLSKTQTGTQTIESNLEIRPLAGSIRDAIFPNENGRLTKTRFDYHGVYSTLPGGSNWSRLIRINATVNNQLDYKAGIDFIGVNSQQGKVWIEFTLDASGDMVSNNLQLFGDFDPARFKMVKIASFIYDVFVQHTEATDFFKWRPRFSFGSKDKYTYFHQESLIALPAGDQYDFKIFGALWTNADTFIYRDGPVVVGSNARLDTGANFEIYGRVSQVDLGASTYFGFEAGLNDDLSGNVNTAFGHQAMKSTVGGVTGYQNSAFGAFALMDNIEGWDNTAIGRSSMQKNTNGYQNTSLGSAALFSNLTGNRNVAIGWASMINRITGDENVAVGYNSGEFNDAGSLNVFVGTRAGADLTSGSNNVIVGSNPDTIATTSLNNSILVGSLARVSGNGHTNEIVIGYNVVGNGSNTTTIGNGSTTKTYLKGKLNVSGGVTTPAVGAVTNIGIDSNGDIVAATGGGGGLPPIDGSYINQFAMIFSQGSQTTNYIYYDGTEYWEYLGTTNGDISDYRPIHPPDSKTRSWSSVSSPGSSRFAICFGQGRFIVLDLFSNVQISSNGINWESSAIGVTGDWYDVIYADNQFVAVGDPGKIITSPDGVTWTSRTAPQASYWRSITYGNGTYVAISLNGTEKVMTSPDGITWTLRSVPNPTYSWYRVAYGAGLFVAISTSGTNRVMTSPDGITWTEQTVTEATSWRDIWYGNGLFVAVGDLGTNRIMVSEDGINWTFIAAPAQYEWLNLTYGNGLFLATCYDQPDEVMTSKDGYNWEVEYVGNFSGRWRKPAYGNGVYLVVATNTNNCLRAGAIIDPAIEKQHD